MFTAEQIMAAHSKVKSGADFPAYIQEIKSLGVTHYETFVTDGHTNFHHKQNHTVKVSPKYSPIDIIEQVNADVFQFELRRHQQGETSYMEFITMCAQNGISKWEICMDKMTCTYQDAQGNAVYMENIPQ